MTTETRTVYESAEGLSPAARDALRNLLIACADTKLLLGYHYGEWTFGTPALEAAVANCSLAQSELGHVRLLHGILKAHFGEDPDALVEKRPATAFANVAYLDAPLRQWPAVVAMNFVVDLAVTQIIHAMRESTFLPMRACAEKLLDEERYHIHHGRGWFRTLASRAASRGALAPHVEAALARTIVWLGPEGTAADAALVEAGVTSAPAAEIRRALIAEVSEAGTSAGLALHAVFPSAFPGWDSTTRRTNGGAPSDEVLYHLRGTKNAMFKLN